MSKKADFAISRAMQEIARDLDRTLEKIAGERVGFSLMVWGERAQYVSNSDRAEVSKAMRELLERWSEGIPDVPAHEVQ